LVLSLLTFLPDFPHPPPSFLSSFLHPSPSIVDHLFAGCFSPGGIIGLKGRRRKRGNPGKTGDAKEMEERRKSFE
jgi:hypothetical protein